MKLGIIGTGMIVNEFLKMTTELPEIQLSAILSTERSVPKAEKLQEEYKIGATFSKTEDFLASEIDTVYVAVPNHLHYGFAKQALLAGKHVICEKPFTLKYDELPELKEIAEEKELILIEAVTNQYLPNYQKIKEALPEIGQVRLIECNYSQYSSRYDAFRKGEVLPAFNPKFGGGALMDINIYNIHFVLGLFGLPKGVEYYGNIQKGVDTSGILMLDYGSFKAACIGAKDSFTESHATIQGEDGTIIVKSPSSTIIETVLQHKGSEQKISEKSTHHRMYDEFKKFDTVIREKNLAFAAEQLDHSLAVMKVVEEASTKAGLELG
ncbi:Gfo/Idh/MocA family oxidoreductase [Enterococcus devriesei]|uniref:Gfo/Idh/MocA family protein n=1 Tax=Enterococcus devriesei TaxID=319970 RepID=UPI0028ED6DBC|nr:Gfo/Idh/MocA family oxidoreductase [Enterococcus devriesei]